MNDIKGALQSKAIWSAAVGMGIIVLQGMGRDVTGIDQEALTGHIMTGVGILANVYAIYGRVTATTKITGILPK